MDRTMDRIEVMDFEVTQAADNQYYGSWMTEVTDEDGYSSSTTHFTNGCATEAAAKSAAEAAIGKE